MGLRFRRRVTVSVALGPVLVAAVSAALAMPAVAPSPAVALTDVVRSAGVAAASTPLTRLRVVNHNIEKRSHALARALEAARRTDADIITLQEVCWWQADELRRTHPEWTIAWKVERDNDKCHLRAGTAETGTAGRGTAKTGPAEVGPAEVGNLAIWTGGTDGTRTAHTFRQQRVTGERVGLACVTWVSGARHRACSVHLISPFDRRQISIRTSQAKDVRRITGRWIRQDDLVVLGGDFNAQPGRRTMNYLYDHDGMGRFREATTRRRGGRDCRCRQSTTDRRKVKIDYVFFSRNRVAPRAHRRLRVVRTASDHHLLVGWADVDAASH